MWLIYDSSVTQPVTHMCFMCDPSVTYPVTHILYIFGSYVTYVRLICDNL